MYFDTEQLEYGVFRYREMLKESERLRSWAGKGWRPFKMIEAVSQAAEWLVRRYDREAELCAQGLTPACEMLTG